METISDRLAELRKRQADQIEELEREAALIPLLPIEPKRIHFATRLEPWITYEAANILDAALLVEAFTPLPGAAVEAGCLYVGPKAEKEAGERGRLRWKADELCEATLERGRGFGSNVIGFWIALGSGIARIKIESKAWPWKAAPDCQVRYNHGGDVTSSRHELPALGEWKRVKWGGSPDYCRFSLYFDSKVRFLSWLREMNTWPDGLTSMTGSDGAR